MNHPPDDLLEALNQLQGMDPKAALDRLGILAQTHPGDPRPLLLLAGQHAEAQDYDRAEEAYLAALQRAPGYAIARFQLGLLQFTGGRPGEALATWAPLEQLSLEHPLRLFATALACLAQDRFQEAVGLLEAGIARNLDIPPLNHDMQRVIQRIQEAGVLPNLPPTGEGGGDDAHYLLSAYRQQP